MPWPSQPYFYPRIQVLIDFAAPQGISTETPLLPLTEWGATYDILRFVLDNQSANKVYLVAEHGETNLKADVERRVIEIAANKQGSISIRDVAELYWSVSAYSDPDLAYPASNVRWRVIARLRV